MWEPFWTKIIEPNASLSSKIHVLFMLHSVLFFSVKCFLSVYLPFCFLSCLNAVYNSFRIHTCYALAIVSDIHETFLLKLIWNSSCDALYWWIVHVSLSFTWNQWMTITWWLSCLCWNPMYESFVLFYLFDSIAQWLYVFVLNTHIILSIDSIIWPC